MTCQNCDGLGRWCIGPWDEEQAMPCGICGGTGESTPDAQDRSSVDGAFAPQLSERDVAELEAFARRSSSR